MALLMAKARLYSRFKNPALKGRAKDRTKDMTKDRAKFLLINIFLLLYG